ncbi:hypothetical protein CDV31_017250 [Fusarium ambrosium]|uniref:Uncharacterized protein n=1 Tax=Fusarium ambrosium TaxID=131363 RepID=A0A428RMT7_9HYPO|nr:hypothetical protein CDV31_017250 [Fusarium ambrosium]
MCMLWLCHFRRVTYSAPPNLQAISQERKPQHIVKALPPIQQCRYIFKIINTDIESAAEDGLQAPLLLSPSKKCRYSRRPAFVTSASSSHFCRRLTADRRLRHPFPPRFSAPRGIGRSVAPRSLSCLLGDAGGGSESARASWKVRGRCRKVLRLEVVGLPSASAGSGFKPVTWCNPQIRRANKLLTCMLVHQVNTGRTAHPEYAMAVTTSAAQPLTPVPTTSHAEAPTSNCSVYYGLSWRGLLGMTIVSLCMPGSRVLEGSSRHRTNSSASP